MLYINFNEVKIPQSKEIKNI